MGAAHSRAFGVLGLLRRSTRPLGLSAIASELHVATSSAHAILTSLLELDVVTIDADKRYQLGPRLFYTGSAYATNSAIYRASWSDLVDLAQEFRVSAALVVPWEHHHLVIAVHLSSGRGPSLAPGTRFPLDGGSYGKVYYALSGEELPVPDSDPDPARPKSSIVDYARFAEEVAEARRSGYAIDDQEFAPGVAAVASGVTSSGGYEGLLALWNAPASRISQEIGFGVVGKALSERADRASLVLGDLSREQSWPQAR
jgi:DNA-binding IclR family transcriptional regulator